MHTDELEFVGFQKMGRLSREMIITEKIDGTNASIRITEELDMFPGSKDRFITPGKVTDNFGFAWWCQENKDELLKLGPGLHFGEWWGQGIQRSYGLKEKRFSLFNVARWGDDGTDVRPACCHVVPTLYKGMFNTNTIDECLNLLKEGGSIAVPGFMNPEGIVIFHTAANIGFKKTIFKDESPKSLYEGKL